MSSQVINYVDFHHLQQQADLRMIVVKGLPSPWGEAAKGIFHLKKLQISACYHDPSSREMSAWTNSRSAPVVIYNNEQPLSSWLDILMLAERLETKNPLLPKDAKEREDALTLCHKICSDMGLGWCRRLDAVHKGLNGQSLQEGAYPQPIAMYLAKKYGYQETKGPYYRDHAIAILKTLSDKLNRQYSKGQKYFFGDHITAVDIYCATFIACFKPLPEEQCAMMPPIRTVFESLDEKTKEALDPILIEHRDFIYSKHLSLPLSL